MTTQGPIAGVIGQPIAQSLSPLVHGTWLKRFGLAGTFLRREIAPESFEADVTALLRDEGWAGMSVTVPHKEAAYSYVDVLHDSAKRLGAVNTILMREDGKTEGRNTDLYGFKSNLETAVGWDGIGRDRAVVLGAGGAARAVIAALQELGFREIQIVNRTVARAESLAVDLAQDGSQLTVSTKPDLEGCDCLVNSTSLGMVGQPPLDIDLSALSTSAFVTDIVYKPLETGILAAARARGNPTVDGLGMLLHQAVPSFTAWFHPPGPPVVDEDLRQTVLEAMSG